MSRSFRKNPICGIAGTSDKWYKTLLHGRERTRLRNKLASGDYDVGYILAVFDSWSSQKDGKTSWFGLKRTDPLLYKKLLRK